MVSIYFILNFHSITPYIIYLICGMNLLKYILPKYPPAGSSGPLLLGYYLLRESALRTKLSWLKLFTKWYKPSFVCVLVRFTVTSYWRIRLLLCFYIKVDNNHFCNKTYQHEKNKKWYVSIRRELSKQVHLSKGPDIWRSIYLFLLQLPRNTHKISTS